MSAISRFVAKTQALLWLCGSLVVASIATAFWATPGRAAVLRAPVVDASDVEALQRRHLSMPVKGVSQGALQDNFEEGRGKRRHEAIDILAPRGTPVVAVADGRIAKLFTSVAGGITVYQFDPDERFVYYYAHLDRYAENLKQGDTVKRGDVLGYVGTTGNAPKNTPHLHFAIFRLGDEKKWWKGTAINPYPFLAQR